MNGPEHYKEAEQLLAMLPNVERGAVSEAGIIAEAQVHATLALAAATRDAAYGELSIPAGAAWDAVLGGGSDR
jgi:hypothetical protein